MVMAHLPLSEILKCFPKFSTLPISIGIANVQVSDAPLGMHMCRSRMPHAPVDDWLDGCFYCNSEAMQG